MKSPKSNFGASPISEVKILRKRFKAQYKGHRKQVISLTCQSFKTAQKIQKSSHRRKEFFELAEIPSKGRDRLNIVTEVLVYVMSGDKSEKKRKLAWKRSRAVQYLHESGVAVGDLEGEIVRRGGIEALVREASKETPRRTVSQPHPHPSVSNNATGKAESTVKDDEAVKTRRPFSNDLDTLVTLKISLSNLDKMRDLKPGRQAKLTVTRLVASSPLAEVKRVRSLE
jgi:hypothetical protein